MKLLIVEDELLVRVGIKSLLDWDSYGIDEVLEADNGQRALELISEYKPDILFTDIKMPIMDGIELLENIQKMEKAPLCVVLTNFGEFNLARNAMRLGAFDFILKSELNEEKLSSVLNEIMLKVNEEQSSKSLSKTSKSGLGDLWKKYLFLENHDKPVLDDLCAFMDIKKNEFNMHVILLRIAELYKFENMGTDEYVRSTQSISNFIGNHLESKNLKGVSFPIRTGEFCIMVFSKQTDDFGYNSVDSICSFIFEFMEQAFGVKTFAALSRCSVEEGGIEDAYSRAEAILKLRFFYEPGKIISKKMNTDDKSFIVSHFPNDLKEKLVSALYIQDLEGINSSIMELIEFFKKKNLGIKSVRMSIMRLFQILSEYLESRELLLRDILKSSYLEYDQIVGFPSYSGFAQWLELFRSDINQFISSDEKKDYHSLIIVANRYIEQNYEHDITLQEIANYLGLNPSYFSTLYKKETGLTFSAGLRNYRVEESKKLLVNTKLKVNDISTRVGYYNTFYFCKIFKSNTGFTPTEYRRNQNM